MEFNDFSEIEMEIEHSQINQVAIFKLDGSLLGENDRLNLKNQFTEYIDKNVYNFIVDLSNLKHINSTGLGVFITLYTKVRGKGGEMILTSPSENIVNLLSITKLNTVFTVVSSLEDGYKKAGLSI